MRTQNKPFYFENNAKKSNNFRVAAMKYFKIVDAYLFKNS